MLSSCSLWFHFITDHYPHLAHSQSLTFKICAIWQVLEVLWKLWSLHTEACVALCFDQHLSHSLNKPRAIWRAEKLDLKMSEKNKSMHLCHWGELRVTREPYVEDHLSEVSTIWVTYKKCIWKLRVEYYNIF